MVRTNEQKRMNWLGITLAIVALIAVGCVLMGLWGWETLDTYPDGLQVPHLSCRGDSVFPGLSAGLCDDAGGGGNRGGHHPRGPPPGHYPLLDPR